MTNAGLFDPVEPGEDFIWIAELECEPFCTEWVQYGERIHVYHELVVPESVYDIQTIDSMFSPSVEDNFATPFIMTTPRWGDVAGMFDAEAQEWTPPNADTNALSDILDVLAIVEGFLGLPTAANKTRWDLEGLGTGFIDGKINISDVLRGVEAFANLDYPFSPTGDPCP